MAHEQTNEYLKTPMKNRLRFIWAIAPDARIPFLFYRVVPISPFHFRLYNAVGCITLKRHCPAAAHATDR